MEHILAWTIDIFVEVPKRDGARYEGLFLICIETLHVMGFSQFRNVGRA